MKQLRVVVADDSALCRALLREMLEREGDIVVVGEAADGDEAKRSILQHRPHLATIDVEMPGTGGLTAIGRIMADCPVPILVVTGRPPEGRGATLFEAVRRGALDLFPKPPAGNAEEARALRALVRTLAAVPVIRHLPTRSMRPLRDARATTTPRPPSPVGEAAPLRALRVVGIGASAGGPTAIAAVLGGLPRNFDPSIAIVQHLLPGFARSFCEFLRQQGPLDVCLVEGRVSLRPRTVFVAPDARHLVATRGDFLEPADGPPLRGHRPAVDMLFQSLAEVHRAAAAGIVLSGMGDDGAKGLARMVKAGALALAQAEEGCTVYGMPKAAVAEASARAMSLADIAAVLTRVAAGAP